jgi:hypothetical protein
VELKDGIVSSLMIPLPANAGFERRLPVSQITPAYMCPKLNLPWTKESATSKWLVILIELNEVFVETVRSSNENIVCPILSLVRK